MEKIKYILKNNGISIVFIVFLFVFSLGFLLTPDKENSTTENRPLQQKPELTTDTILQGSYQKDMAAYISDQFFMRSTWVKIHSNLQYELGKKEMNGVFIGKDNELFQESVVVSQKAIKEKSEAMNTFAKAHSDLKMSMLLVPNKATILEDKLPAHISNQNQISRIHSFQKGLDTTIQYVDASKTLLEHKNEKLYYRSDHHWTNRGAYLVFEAWKNVILPEDGLLTYESYCVNDSFYGSLANTSGFYRGKADSVDIVTSKNDPQYTVKYAQKQVTTTSLFDESKANSSNPYEVFLGGNQPLLDISTTVENQKHLLILKDSFANSYVSYILPYYSSITIVDPRYYYEDLNQLIKDRNITDVLFLYNANTFFSDTSLQSLLKESGN